MQTRFTKDFFKAALVRAIKTSAQVMLSMLTVGVAITSFNWVQILSITATSFIYSILTSIVFGVPEGEFNGTLGLRSADEDNDAAVVLSIKTPYEDLLKRGNANFKIEKEN